MKSKAHPDKIITINNLITAVEAGANIKYLFFWGHQKPDSGVNKSCLSQWYQASFSIDGVLYHTAEHYMMAEKAKLFNDQRLYKKILTASHPSEAKRLGREIIGFDERVWCANRFDIVVKGNLAKFSQNPTLQNYLLGTQQRVLVEASPVDRIWGIGLAADHADATNPAKWKGENLLGFALMLVRQNLLKQSHDS
ncbi:NADAR family protein [Zooshikella marina]|uniref:NADAR family protein n=1 Tax=Zooshikella ganghwensis TaxID=202772 RepID=UPI001BB0246A|nr:NADAR family protein [Zooshikella ganghwensis]MBU2706647.1 NADAR family protein [Zooshikella ganghwensis]